jgi:aminoglycoside phosphotransferase (APT) family kinase protein
LLVEKPSAEILPEVGKLQVPSTLEEAVKPAWLTQALARFSGGDRVVSVAVNEIIKTMASKVRIAVTFAGKPDQPYALCLKAFLDNEREPGLGGLTTLRESDFYQRIAPHLTLRTPSCAAVVADREAGRGFLIMTDLVAAGARFCLAREPFGIEQTAQTLEQIARLHARSDLLSANDWIPCRAEAIANRPMFSAEKLQLLMRDARRGDLPDRTLNAALLLEGMKRLAARNAQRPQTLLHGDCHGGNVYMTANGPGFTDWQLIQRGNWALDVAYHIAAVLPAETAEREERRLLDHYLDMLGRHGGRAPPRNEAWEDYRCAQIYGYYHWAITSKTDPANTNVVFQRLGAGVTRHGSYNLLGLSHRL